VRSTSASTPIWRQAVTITGAFVALLWVLEIVDSVTGNALDPYGVQPRETDGLVGIVAGPALHFGFDHLGANTVPVLVLGFLALVTGIARGLAATAIIWVVGGVGVWLLGPDNTVHAGASLLIFGWIVYLIVAGFFTRRVVQILIGVAVFFLYGGALWGVLPSDPHVSWQGHLFGALGGFVAAWMLRPAPERRAPSH
jgi:membrane associated rhomboid family serine protease